MIPGNCLRDNWFMGPAPIQIKTLGDLILRTEGFCLNFKLTDGNGNDLTIRMNLEEGGLIIEPQGGSL